MAERFADLSHHNAAVDLAAYAAAGHTRVVLKATEGTGWTDPEFADRWAAAGRARLHRGAYHFGRAASSGAAQADYLLEVVNAAGGLSPGDWLVLDLEDSTAPNRASAFATEFCGRMVARGHPSGLVYTGRWYATPTGITPGILPPGWRRLWLSDYGTVSDGAMRLPAGWSRDQVAARQYTNAATVPGITGGCDYSRIITDWLTQEESVALTAGEITAIAKAVWAFVIPDPHPEGDPDGAPASSHLRWAQARTRVIQERLGVDGSTLPATPPPVGVDALSAKVDALTAKVDALALGVGDPAAVRAAIRAELDATRLAGPESTQ